MPIRCATATDIPELMALEKDAATAAHWSKQQYEAAFARETPLRLVLMLEEESGAQGFITGSMLDKEWEIENIVVAEPVRRHGLGARLLGEFLGLVRERGASKVFLEVRESNLARRLYEKRAFAESGRRKRYYQDPEEDAIVYQLSFT